MLTLQAPTPQNGETHSNNSSAISQQIVWVCLTILWGWRLKDWVPVYKKTRFSLTISLINKKILQFSADLFTIPMNSITSLLLCSADEIGDHLIQSDFQSILSKYGSKYLGMDKVNFVEGSL